MVKPSHASKVKVLYNINVMSLNSAAIQREGHSPDINIIDTVCVNACVHIQCVHVNEAQHVMC